MKKLIVLGLAFAAVCTAFAGEWTFTKNDVWGGYDSGSLRSADGWELNVWFDAPTERMCVRGYVAGEGVLDLNDPIVNGTPIQYVRFWNQVFKAAPVTEFRCNKFDQASPNDMTWALFMNNQTLEKFSIGGTGCFEFFSDFVRNCPNLTDLVVEIPNMTNFHASAVQDTPALERLVIRSDKNVNFNGLTFQDRTALKSVVWDLPENKEIPSAMFKGCEALVSVDLQSEVTGFGTEAFDVCTSLVGDISMLVSPSVESIGDCAFEGCSGLTGKLVVTNLHYLGGAAFARTSLQEIDLRGPITTEGWTNGKYKNGVRFSGCTSMTNAVFDLPNLTTLCSGDFSGCWRLKSVYFLRKPFSAESMRYLLNGKGLSPRDCTIYVSSVQWPVAEWAAGGWRALTEDEKNTAAKPPRCFGMCDVGDPSIEEGDGNSRWTQQRLAWFARWKSPCDPERFLLILR